MIITSEAFLAASAAKPEKMFANMFVQYLDGFELFRAISARKGLFGVVNGLDMTPQVGNPTEKSRAQLAHEPFVFGMHDQVIGQMRLLLEANVAGVAFVLFTDHVISLVFVERRRAGECLHANFASQSLRASFAVVVDNRFFRMRLLNMIDQSISRFEIGFPTNVTSQQRRRSFSFRRR